MWEGLDNNGNSVPDGVYFAVIELTSDCSGVIKQLETDITVIGSDAGCIEPLKRDPSVMNKVYPTLVTRNQDIVVELGAPNRVKGIEIINMSGQKVGHSVNISHKNRLNVSSFPSGRYFVILRLVNGESESYSIIVI